MADILPADEPWPGEPETLIALQEQLGRAAPDPWAPAGEVRAVAGCFICFARHTVGPGAAGDPGWAAAALFVDGQLRAVTQVDGAAGAAYVPGLLALREGPLLEAAVRALPARPEVLFVNATGRDHPRRAGLAVHLGARLDLPTVGVTSRPLVASGALPPDVRGARSPLVLGGERVGYWLRVHPGVRPLAVHAAWRTGPDVAVAVTLAATGRALAPEPLRQARRAAREARAANRRGG
jgi:deoxyribonuclease V